MVGRKTSGDHYATTERNFLQTIENRPPVQQLHHFLNRPNMIGDSRFHRRGDPERLNAHVMSSIKRRLP
jgi:hypothetical protein